jgi:hypothetical protein
LSRDASVDTRKRSAESANEFFPVRGDCRRHLGLGHQQRHQAVRLRLRLDLREGLNLRGRAG